MHRVIEINILSNVNNFILTRNYTKNFLMAFDHHWKNEINIEWERYIIPCNLSYKKEGSMKA